MYLERWTIDELTESTATLLRSVYRGEIDATDTGNLREVVSSRERDLTSEVWSEEDDFVLDRQVLERFIYDAVGSSDARDLPRPRELREGDVYWIRSEEPVPPPQDTIGPDIGPDDTKQFLAAYRDRSVQVWDVTAAARQAAKVTYFQAIESAEKKKRSG